MLLFCADFYGRDLKLHESDSLDDKEVVRSVIQNNVNLSMNEPRESDNQLKFVTLMKFTGHKNELSSRRFLRRHVCSYCKKVFRVLGQLSIHIRVSHAGGKPLTCPVCNVSFVSKSHFDLHKHVQNNRFNINANQLQEPTEQLEELSSDASASMCRSREPDGNLSQLTNHVTDKTVVKQKTSTKVLYSRFRCSYCKKTFLTPTHLTIHMRSHKRRFLFTCKTCDRSFLNKFYLDRHIELQHQHICGYCKKTFRKLGNLKLHLMQCHSGSQPFTCPACKILFLTKLQFDQHICASSANNINQPVQSSKTLEAFSSDASANSGMVHLPLTCSYCRSTFRHMSGFKNHVWRRHTRRVFTSTACKMMFHNKTDLDGHTSTFSASKTNQPPESDRHPHELAENLTCCTGHENETSTNLVACTALGHQKCHQRFYKRCRPFTCKECNQSFATQLHFDRQTCSHRIKGPFPCEICGQLYTSKRSLNIHALSHVYEPTKTSDVCSQIEQSSTSDDLIKSEITESHICDICKREFEDKRMFDTHMRLHSRLQTLYRHK